MDCIQRAEIKLSQGFAFIRLFVIQLNLTSCITNRWRNSTKEEKHIYIYTVRSRQLYQICTDSADIHLQPYSIQERAACMRSVSIYRPRYHMTWSSVFGPDPSTLILAPCWKWLWSGQLKEQTMASTKSRGRKQPCTFKNTKCHQTGNMNVN